MPQHSTIVDPSEVSLAPPSPRKKSPNIVDPSEVSTAPPAKRVPLTDFLPRSGGPGVAERTRLPRPLLANLEPPPTDTTRFPLDPFTDRYITGPPMATEEEMAAGPTIGPARPNLLQRLRASMAPVEFLKGTETRRTVNHPGYGSRGLLRPVDAMTPLEQESLPELTGASEFIEGLSTPESVALIAGSGGLGAVPSLARGAVPKLVSAYFGASMAQSLYQQSPEFAAAVERGDWNEARRIGTHMALTGGMAGLAFKHAAKPSPMPLGYETLVEAAKHGRTPPTEPVLRGDTLADFTSRNLQDIRGTRAREARIQEPVQIPKLPETTEGPVVIPPRPRLSPMEELSREAQQVREGRDFAGQLRDEIAEGILQRLREEGALEPETRVVDRRTVRPEDVSPVEPKRKFVAGETGPAAVLPQGRILRDIAAREGPSELVPREGGRILPAPTGRQLPAAPEVPGRDTRMPMQAAPPARPNEMPPMQAEPVKAPASRAGQITMSGVKAMTDLDQLRAVVDDANRPQKLRTAAYERWQQVRSRTLPRGVQEVTPEGGRMKAPTGEPLPKAEPAAKRYPPDVIQQAEAEMRGAASLGGSLERPGRYMSVTYKDATEWQGRSGEDYIWYGVGANKPTIAGQFPWFAADEVSLSRLNKALEMGKGADYERIVSRIADGIVRERETARPILEEFAPQLRELADKVRSLDPDLAQSMLDIAAGDAVGLRNLKPYIEGKINDAEAALLFSKAIDEATATARAAEPAELGGKPRPQNRPTERPEKPPELTTERAEGVLPGMERAVREQAEGAARVQGDKLTEKINEAPESIERAAGEMERSSPLFRGTEASPQKEIFGTPPERKPAPREPGDEFAATTAPPLPSVATLTAPREVISRGQILQELSQRLNDLPIRVGRTFARRPNALGLYFPRSENVRLRTANDIPVAAHEVGHHINKILWGLYSKPSGRMDLNWKPLEPFRSELNPRNGFGYVPKGRSFLPESFADYVMTYLTDPAKAKSKAPRFTKFWESELAKNADLRETLLNAQQQIERYIRQPAEAKILSQISKQETPTGTLSWDRFYTYTVDALTPIKRVVEAMKERSGKALATENNAYELARLFAGWWGKADHFLKTGTFDQRTLAVTGKPLREILRPVEGRLDDLRVYLVARRAIEKAGQGKETGIEIADARQAVNRLGTPEFQRIAGELYDYNTALLQYIRDAGVINDAQYTTIRLLNRDYVPFYRVFEERQAEPLRAGGKRFADVFSPVKRMKGSSRAIVDPLESVIKNTYTFINLAERNAVARALVKQAKATEGSGKWVELIDTPMKPTSFELQEVAKSLAEAGLDVVDGAGGSKGVLLADGTVAPLDVVATVFRPSHVAPKAENILTVLEKGQRNFYQVHPDLYRALQGLDQESTHVLVRILSMPARSLRTGATALGPEFVWRNPARDTLDAFFQSKTGFKPVVDTARGLFHVVKRDDLYHEWQRSGGQHAAMVSLDRTTLQKSLKELLRSQTAFVVRHPIEALRMFSETTEAATRVGEYARARKQGLTPRAAGFGSREVAIDFARMGAKTRALNSIIAFWNAAVQGTDKFLRTHRDNPMGTAAKAVAGVTLPSLLLYMVNRDDPRYGELPRWQKDFFWIVPIGDQLWRIPKPFLWGMVYGSSVERIAEWIDTHDPAAFDELGKSLWESTMPEAVPTAAAPLLEAWANKSFFTGRPLEPQYLQQIEPEYRAQPYTSQFSRQMARALAQGGIHVSPIKLDNAIFGYTGSFGRTVVKQADPLLRGRGPQPPARTLSDIPVVTGFAVRFPASDAQSIQDFYERLNELERKYRTQRFGAQYPDRAPDAERLSPQEMRELLRLRQFGEQMQAVGQEVRRVHASERSPQDKRSEIERLQYRMIDLARASQGKGELRDLPAAANQ